MEAADERGDAGWRGGVSRDLAIAAGIALVLTVGWAMKDWSRLSRLLLPDHDDMMRLAQVRDWLAGQATNDWTQYRMAPPDGSPMHWSRVNDLGIAALILLASPLVGQAPAELFAVLVYPGLLFACALFLSARIGARLWGTSGGLVAMVLTALAYPGTTVFVPGRIDHHALQVVLVQSFVLLLMHPPGRVRGVLAGAVAAVSLVVGLETAPQVFALVGVLALFWVVRGSAEVSRLSGFAAGLGMTTLLFVAFLRPKYWPAALCDAFTPASATATLLVAAALGALAAGSARLDGWRQRIVAGAILGTLAVGLTLAAFPGCISGPYGTVDPFLLRYFIPMIDEANGLFAQPRLGRIIAIGGVVTAACVASVWMAWRERGRWPITMPIAAVVLVSGLIMMFQVRGTYLGAPLGAPVLAGLVVVARRRTRWQVPAIIGAWLVSAGVVHATASDRIERLTVAERNVASAQTKTHVRCSVGDTWEQVGHRPAGVAMASTKVAAYLLVATHHSTVGAGYHRNNRGNIAMYHFFLSAPERSLQIARDWKTDYVLFCPGDFGEIDVSRRFPGSLAAALERGRTPAWLEPLALHGTPLKLYRVR
jgi:hypothetical protein